MKLDDLDHRILEHFSRRFPKPSGMDYCEYDVSADEVEQLCGDPELYARTTLLSSFTFHNRLGMFGDWRNFPPFCGEIAVLCRRLALSYE